MKHEIIQALECCIKRETIPCDNRNCPYFNKTNKYKDCQNLLYENVLKYITGETGINPPNRTSGVMPPAFHIDGREVMRLTGFLTPKNNKTIDLLRPCYVNGKKALFHEWVQRRDIIPPSVARGGHTGGVIEYTLAIVEFENGSVYEVQPKDIHFADSAGIFSQIAFDEREG